MRLMKLLMETDKKTEVNCTLLGRSTDFQTCSEQKHLVTVFLTKGALHLSGSYLSIGQSFINLLWTWSDSALDQFSFCH